MKGWKNHINMTEEVFRENYIEIFVICDSCKKQTSVNAVGRTADKKVIKPFCDNPRCNY